MTSTLGELAEPVQAVTSLVVLVGAGLYATIRFGQQVFYNKFGVRPEEVGQTYAASVSRAAVTIVTFVSAVVLWHAATQVWNRLSVRVSARLGDRPAAKAATPVISAIVGAALGAVVMYLFYLLGGALLFAMSLAYAVVFSPMLLSAFRSMTARFGRNVPLPAEAITGTFREPSGVLAGIAVLLCGLLLLSGFTANRSADSVKAGQAVAPASGFGILGLRAEPVLVIGELPEDLELSNRDIMYLGQADGTVVLYDRGSEETIRAPADGIAVFPGNYILEYLSLHPDQDVDLDVYKGVARAGEVDPFDVDLSWREDKLQIGTRLAPTSLVRAGIADDALIPSRNACTRLEKSFEQLDVEDLHRGLRLCVHTDENRWVFITVADIQESPRRISLETVAWPA